MIELDNKYGNIIESEARHYVATYKAVFVDIPVKIHVFSDLLILIKSET